MSYMELIEDIEKDSNITQMDREPKLPGKRDLGDEDFYDDIDEEDDE